MKFTLRYLPLILLATASTSLPMNQAGPKPVEPKPYTAPKTTCGSVLSPLYLFRAAGVVTACNVTFADAVKQIPANADSAPAVKNNTPKTRQHLTTGHKARQQKTLQAAGDEVDEYAMRKAPHAKKAKEPYNK